MSSTVTTPHQAPRIIDHRQYPQIVLGEDIGDLLLIHIAPHRDRTAISQGANRSIGRGQQQPLERHQATQQPLLVG